MRIINQASVYLVGRQVIDFNAMDNFLADHGTEWVRPEDEKHGLLAAAEDISEIGGRLCYMSFAKPRPGGNAAYLDNIKESGHGSVLEHAVYNLLITGVSRTLTHELVRHRAGVAYSQLSQRYVDESVAEYVEPDIIASDPELHKLWTVAVADAHEAYIELVDKIKEKLSATSRHDWVDAPKESHNMEVCKRCGKTRAVNEQTRDIPDCTNTFAARWVVGDGSKTELTKLARQSARSVLPNACETKILFTANARAVRHFIEMRGSKFAEPEIRKLANQILHLVRADSPSLFSDYTLSELPDGTHEITTPHRKV